MRVIAGTFRSRLLTAPPGQRTRPTSDRLRETLFNVLAPWLPGAHFADLYAGSGAVGIEALSRGAAHGTFMERAPAALTALQNNLRALDLSTKSTVIGRPVARALADAATSRQSFDLIFLDPPYEAAEEYTATFAALGREHAILLSPQGLVVAEHARRTPLLPVYGALRRHRLLEQGDAALSFYTLVEAEPEGRL